MKDLREKALNSGLFAAVVAKDLRYSSVKPLFQWTRDILLLELTTSVRGGRRGPASARGPRHRGAHAHELKPRANACTRPSRSPMLARHEQLATTGRCRGIIPPARNNAPAGLAGLWSFTN